MSFELLDTVVLSEDLPDKGLKSGDVGAVVEIYPGNRFDVEFVTGAGKTLALLTLSGHQIHAMGPGEILSVRQMNAA
ncbi:DUF4926 domain-containing protein [Wenzhouxiangella sp. AB-CW3]|uniref:DUF4926 domain-containing protein n=1 Tax=Wenzhouxiangella sp. AB-CW3 TaxID=2771012 RepID=UPI00168BCFEB|nr:DUF4926 domain-containing protein [Wenzhouxiangella sp. AB-CW3]QOC21534.1 DUF4926 domain-containing protein [Wenzhouxiangella sp. AB-CW3]